MENFRKLYSSEDFVEQILLRLPPKSLMRFHAVCNLWCNLIKSPNFVAKHLSTSIRASCMPILLKRQVLKDEVNNTKHEKEVENDDDDLEILLSSLILRDENDDDSFLSVAEVEEYLNLPLPAPLKVQHSPDLKIQGHCDGIICIKLFVGNVILCNPAMKEFRLLPKSFLLLPKDDFDLWSLEYEFDCYTEYLGFGYDPKGKDFKIVRFVIYDESCYWFRAEVYSMNSNSWRDIKTESNLLNTQVNACFDMPLYLNGICYLYVAGYYMVCGELESGNYILSFDMSNEQFHEILIPDFADDRWVVKLALWKESISIFTYHQRTRSEPARCCGQIEIGCFKSKKLETMYNYKYNRCSTYILQ